VIGREDQESWPWYVQEASYRDQLELLWQYEPLGLLLARRR
jgi:hypothetical protein